MIGIITWNIGKGKVQNLFDSFKQKVKRLPDILVIGLQELPLTTTKTILDNIQLDGYRLIQSYLSCFLNFKIGMLIYEKVFSTKVSVVDVRLVASYCYRLTKGFLIVNLSLSTRKNQRQEIVLSTCHFPLKDLDTLKKFYNFFLKKLRKHCINSENIIVFGDVNSRSELNIKYTKKIPSCLEEVKYDYHHYCQVNNYLEQLSLDTITFGKFNKKIFKYFMSTDVLKSFNKEFQEKPIKFIPTYKIDPITKKFSLKNRLAGYPDRILYTGKDIKCTRYDVLKLFENDHFPVFGLFRPFSV